MNITSIWNRFDPVSQAVLSRLALRVCYVVGLALLMEEFAAGVWAFSLIFASLCMGVAISRSEPIVGPVLTHWDEAALLFAFAYLACWLPQG